MTVNLWTHLRWSQVRSKTSQKKRDRANNRSDSISWRELQDFASPDSIWTQCHQWTQYKRRQKSSISAWSGAKSSDSHDLPTRLNTHFWRKIKGMRWTKQDKEWPTEERNATQTQTTRESEWFEFPFFQISRYDEPIHTTIYTHTMLHSKQQNESRIQHCKNDVCLSAQHCTDWQCCAEKNIPITHP